MPGSRESSDVPARVSLGHGVRAIVSSKLRLAQDDPMSRPGWGAKVLLRRSASLRRRACVLRPHRLKASPTLALCRGGALGCLSDVCASALTTQHLEGATIWVTHPLLEARGLTPPRPRHLPLRTKQRQLRAVAPAPTPGLALVLGPGLAPGRLAQEQVRVPAQPLWVACPHPRTGGPLLSTKPSCPPPRLLI